MSRSYTHSLCLPCFGAGFARVVKKKNTKFRRQQLRRSEKGLYEKSLNWCVNDARGSYSGKKKFFDKKVVKGGKIIYRSIYGGR